MNIKPQLFLCLMLLTPLVSMGQKCKVKTSKSPTGKLIKKTKDRVFVAHSIGYQIGLTDYGGNKTLHWRMDDSSNVYIEKDHPISFTLEDGSEVKIYPDDIYSAYKDRMGWYHDVNYVLKQPDLDKLAKLKVISFKVTLADHVLEETVEKVNQSALMSLINCL